MRQRALGLIAGVGLLGLCGCAGNSLDARAAAIRSNLTPEMQTLYQRPADVDNAIAITFNENWRMFNQDLGRFFYWDRPSRLAREPINR